MPLDPHIAYQPPETGDEILRAEAEKSPPPGLRHRTLVYSLIVFVSVLVGLVWLKGYNQPGCFLLFASPGIGIAVIAVIVRWLHHQPQYSALLSLILVSGASVVGYLCFWPVCFAAGLTSMAFASKMYGPAEPGLFVSVAVAVGIACFGVAIFCARAGFGKTKPAVDNDDSTEI